MIGWFRNATLLLLVAFLWLALSALASPRIEIRSPGRYGPAPSDWWITIRLDPHPEDRWLIIEVTGEPGEYRRSDVALEGEKAAKSRQVWFKSLSAGCYWFVATVADHSQALAVDRLGPVSIVGLEGDLCPD